MPPIPFHRRVLLWVFVLAFLVLAPAVVFYTAGYRWNPKKGIIERNGTLILDTNPSAATVTLNGKIGRDRTPVTLQNVAPGTYRIRLELDGFAPWEKTLEVRAERVTFVNNVWLWRMSDPRRLWESDARAVAVSSDGRTLATVEGFADGAQVAFRDTDGALVSTQPFSETAPTGTVQLIWNTASSAVMVKDEAGRAWLARRSSLDPALPLPAAESYRWANGEALGLDADGTQTLVDASNGGVRRVAPTDGELDADGTFRVILQPETGARAVQEHGTFQEQLFGLPAGAWRFAGREGGWLFMEHEGEWLGFRPDGNGSPSFRIPADEIPSTFRRGSEAFLLSQGGGELWLTTLEDGSAELLERTGDRIIGSAWHRDGNDVFYATEHEVIALGLDPRDGRERIVLAAFDSITGFASDGRALFISGERRGVSGVWAVNVE